MLHTVETTIETIEMHPMAGTSITIGSVFIGAMIKIVDNGHINPVIMDIVQLGAWSTAILVGAFTIRSYVKKDKARVDPPEVHD